MKLVMSPALDAVVSGLVSAESGELALARVRARHELVTAAQASARAAVMLLVALAAPASALCALVALVAAWRLARALRALHTALGFRDRQRRAAGMVRAALAREVDR